VKMPCEECLKYAICKTKVTIECDDLQSIFDETLLKLKHKHYKSGEVNALEFLQSDQRSRQWESTWVEIRKTLPKLKSIYRDQHHEYAM